MTYTRKPGLSAPQVARALGVSVRTVQRARDERPDLWARPQAHAGAGVPQTRLPAENIAALRDLLNDRAARHLEALARGRKTAAANRRAQL